MGNRALRKEASKLLGHKVYTGRKFAAFRYLNARRLRCIIEVLKVPKGTIMHDCDGFNHEVGFHDVEKWPVDPVRLDDTRMLARIVAKVDVYKANGNPFCGCTYPQLHSGEVPTQEQIEAYWRGWIAYQGSIESGFADTPYIEEIKRRLDAGEPICDDRGIRVPELTEVYTTWSRKEMSDALSL